MLLTARAAAVGLAALSFLPSVLAKPYPNSLLLDFDGQHNGTDKRQAAAVCNAGGRNCGWDGQICCYGSDQCSTTSNIAFCATAPAGGKTITSVWVDTITRTTVYVEPTGNPCGPSQQFCGGQCCAVGMYCGTSQTCLLLPAGSSGGLIATSSPTATVPFQTPIPTGAPGIPMEQTNGGGGLSGGAIAGIVIGVLLGVFLLFLLCLFCCFRALFNTLMACFGGRKKKHTHEETYIEQHHHSSGAAAGGRRWYGQGPSRPPRSKKSSGGGFGNALGIGALLGGAALALGLKRKHDRKHDEKSTTVSGSSAYYSDDYTSSSSASSSDRHTRHTRHSSRR